MCCSENENSFWPKIGAVQFQGLFFLTICTRLIPTTTVLFKHTGVSTQNKSYPGVGGSNLRPVWVGENVQFGVICTYHMISTRLIPTTTFLFKHTGVSAQNKTCVTFTALHAWIWTFRGGGGIETGGRASWCTGGVMTVDGALHCCNEIGFNQNRTC